MGRGPALDEKEKAKLEQTLGVLNVQFYTFSGISIGLKGKIIAIGKKRLVLTF